MKVLFLVNSHEELSVFEPVMHFCQHEWVVEVVGVGPIMAGINSCKAIRQHKPSLAVNLGFCATFPLSGYLPGDFINAGSVEYPAMKLPVCLEEYCYGAIRVGKKGPRIATVDHFVAGSCVPDTEALLADMEAYAVASASKMAHVDCRVLKVVSDNGDSSAGSDFEKAFSMELPDELSLEVERL